MSRTRSIRLGLAIAACVGVLVLTLAWKTVPAVVEPCSWENSGDTKQPYGLGTCLRGPSTAELVLKLLVVLFSIATVAALAALAAPQRKVVAGATAAALCALVGLTTIQAISTQVFKVGYLPRVEEMAAVGFAFFLYGALIAWGMQKWWPIKSLERPRER